MPLIRCTNVFYKGDYPVTLLPPPRRPAPSLGFGTTWVRQLRSGSCHHPTAATKCSEWPSQATAIPVGGKACSSTKGGLLRYIPNTYSIHKVSSLKFAYFQGKLSRYSCLPLPQGYIHVYDQNIQTSFFSGNSLANQSQTLFGAKLGMENESIHK